MSLLDLDEELNQTLDDTESAPEFIEPPDGKYRLKTVKAGLKGKEVENKEGEEELQVRMNCVYAVVKTYEIGDDQSPVPDGTLVGEGFNWTAEGRPYFKTRCEKIFGVESVKGATVKDLAEEFKNSHEFDCTIRTSETKGSGPNKGKVYRNTRIAILAEAATTEA